MNAEQRKASRPQAFDDLPKHISYVPQGTGSGLQVRIWRDGDTYQKFFATSHFDTPDDCLHAAQKWRDQKLDELPPPKEGIEQTEEVRQKISEQMTRTGIRGFGFQVGKYGDSFRLFATARWREDDTNMSRMRSLHEHGIDGAATQLSRYLTEKVPDHTDKDPAELAPKCATALRLLISRIYEAGTYPSSRHGHEEERYEALAAYVERHETLPLPISGPETER